MCHGEWLMWLGGLLIGVGLGVQIGIRLEHRTSKSETSGEPK